MGAATPHATAPGAMSIGSFAKAPCGAAITNGSRKSAGPGPKSALPSGTPGSEPFGRGTLRLSLETIPSSGRDIAPSIWPANGELLLLAKDALDVRPVFFGQIGDGSGSHAGRPPLEDRAGRAVFARTPQGCDGPTAVSIRRQ